MKEHLPKHNLSNMFVNHPVDTMEGQPVNKLSSGAGIYIERENRQGERPQ